MNPVSMVRGRAYPLGRDNIDTDLILPGRYLKTITRTGLGAAAFESIRAEAGNIFEDTRWNGAPLLVAGANFGCGSSREHAVWAMMDLGIRAVVAESYSDIFAGNAFKNGLLTVALPGEVVTTLLARAEAGETLVIDLAAQSIACADGSTVVFDMDPFRKDCLLRGLDEIALTLAFSDQIAVFEADRERGAPWIAVRA